MTRERLEDIVKGNTWGLWAEVEMIKAAETALQYMAEADKWRKVADDLYADLRYEVHIGCDSVVAYEEAAKEGDAK